MTQTIPADQVTKAREVGRTRIVAGYFAFCGVLTGLVAGAAALSLALRLLSGSRHEAKAISLIALLGLLTFGFVRTYRLLRRYQRSGAYLAALCLAGIFVTELRSPQHDWLSVGISVFGLTLLATAWRELE
jgi:hypothetical protein